MRPDFVRLNGAALLQISEVSMSENHTQDGSSVQMSLPKQAGPLNDTTLAKVANALVLRAETVADQTMLEHLHEASFGPGRFARTAFRLREGKQPRYDLSRLAFLDGDLVGAVRITDIHIGGKPAVLLGPLCARPDLKSRGIGRVLMQASLEAAREAAAGAVLLVGDPPYYAPFGFQCAPAGTVEFPGPVDLSRIMILPFDGGIDAWAGKVR
jgi:predicted N-acetyltransferase YhbS